MNTTRRRRDINALDLVEKLDPAHGHSQIDQDGVIHALVQATHGVGAVPRGVDGEPLDVEQIGQEDGDLGIIVHDQDSPATGRLDRQRALRSS